MRLPARIKILRARAILYVIIVCNENVITNILSVIDSALIINCKRTEGVFNAFDITIERLSQFTAQHTVQIDRAGGIVAPVEHDDACSRCHVWSVNALPAANTADLCSMPLGSSPTSSPNFTHSIATMYVLQSRLCNSRHLTWNCSVLMIFSYLVPVKIHTR